MKFLKSLTVSSSLGLTMESVYLKGLPDPFVLTSQEFRRTLKRLYGSVHAGWVKYLDVTEVACSVDNKKSQRGLKNHPKNRQTTYKPINQKDRFKYDNFI